MAAAGAPPRQATGRQAAALRLWIVARTVFLDELVLAACADGARQVVLLGAGFDTRAFRLPWPPGVRCFELDTPDVLDAKEQVLAAQRVGVYPSDHDDWLAAAQQASGVAEAGLPALLSRVLLAFAIEVERESRLTMVVAANALRVLSTDPVPVADLPLRAGLSKEAISRALGLLERHGYAVTEPDPAASRRKAARLTARGQRAQDDHHRLVAAVEQQWRGQFGADKVDGLANALRGLFAEAGGQQRIASGLVPYPGGWRAHPPYLSQTEAMLANPAAALPYYPMVSHRGGFPDGS